MRIFILVGCVLLRTVPVIAQSTDRVAGAQMPSRPDWLSQGCATDGLSEPGTSRTAGDVNGDGYADVIVAGGRACIYYGSADGLSIAPDWVVKKEEGGQGISDVASAGDVNGDGYSDIILVDLTYGDDYYGRVYVYYGSEKGLNGATCSSDAPCPTNADWILTGAQGLEFLGSPAATAGDVNGDGYDDVIIGSAKKGHIDVFLGSPEGLGMSPDWGADGEQEEAGFGAGAKTAGDVNGDGYDDIIVGAANWFDNGWEGQGQAFIFYGSPSGLSDVADPIAGEGDPRTHHFGWDVSTAGDVNGDGFDDVIVGSFFWNDLPVPRAYLYLGSAVGLDKHAAWVFESRDDYGGAAVGTAGDVNNDGFADVIVGSPYLFRDHDGAAHGFFGSPDGPRRTSGWSLEGNMKETYLGVTVGTAGDVNGDGYDDVIIGALSHGRVYYHLGSEAKPE